MMSQVGSVSSVQPLQALLTKFQVNGREQNCREVLKTGLEAN